MSHLEVKNGAMALIFIGKLRNSLSQVAHTSKGAYEVSSLNATLFNFKKLKKEISPTNSPFVDFKCDTLQRIDGVAFKSTVSPNTHPYLFRTIFKMFLSILVRLDDNPF